MIAMRVTAEDLAPTGLEAPQRRRLLCEGASVAESSHLGQVSLAGRIRSFRWRK
jgi:hypothetical protein